MAHGRSPSATVEVACAFLEEVINQGRLERANDLVALDFVELDPLPGQGRPIKAGEFILGYPGEAGG